MRHHDFCLLMLPDFLFYHLRNVVIFPCSVEPPSMELPENMERKIQDRFFTEVNLLRKLSGQTLASLRNK